MESRKWPHFFLFQFQYFEEPRELTETNEMKFLKTNPRVGVHAFAIASASMDRDRKMTLNPGDRGGHYNTKERTLGMIDLF